MYERRHHPLASRTRFALRLLGHMGVAGGIILVSLLAGVLGFHRLAGLTWVDAILNASMLVGGMGPVDRMESSAAKLFASAYALYAGLILLVSVGIVAAPVWHRVLHRFHLDAGD